MIVCLCVSVCVGWGVGGRSGARICECVSVCVGCRKSACIFI